MKYHVGMYGGSFNPLHLGHVDCLIQAANMCEKLYVVLSEAPRRHEIPVRVRYRWLYTITRHLSHVQIIILQDDSESKADYNESDWTRDAEFVKRAIGEKIDVVFCGSDYDETSFWNVCYPESAFYVFPRNEISSTKIRENPYAHRHWLPRVVQNDYTKKVLLLGIESTGKSVLAQNLALRFNAHLLEETGRAISERSGTDQLMLKEDFVEILLRHKLRELELLEDSNGLLIIDTDAVTTEFYLSFLETKDADDLKRLSSAINEINRYDLILYLEPDVPFIQDGDRSIKMAADRAFYSEQLKSLAKLYHSEVCVLTGCYQERYLKAVERIQNCLKS